MLIKNSLLTLSIVLIFFASPVKAHVPSTGVLMFAGLIYLLPYLVGLLIAGKGQMIRFTLISLFTYLISVGGLYFTSLMNDAGIVLFFLPFSLLFVAGFLRFQKRRLKP